MAPLCAPVIYNTLGNVRHNQMAARSRKRIIAVADTKSPAVAAEG